MRLAVGRPIAIDDQGRPYLLARRDRARRRGFSQTPSEQNGDTAKTEPEDQGDQNGRRKRPEQPGRVRNGRDERDAQKGTPDHTAPYHCWWSREQFVQRVADGPDANQFAIIWHIAVGRIDVGLGHDATAESQLGRLANP